MINTTVPPITKAEAEAIVASGNLGELVGFRYRTKQTVEVCTLGCLAPGSSPHGHYVTDGFYVIGTTGFLLVDAEGNGVRSGTIHPFE